MFLLAHIVYGFYLIFIGLLTFKSRFFGLFLSSFLGIFLVLGGSMGYLLESLTHIFFPSFTWFSSLGVFIAVLVEVILGITLVIEATRLMNKLPDPKITISTILEDLGEATTAEIIDKASVISHDCKDRIPNALVVLEKENRVVKRLSKEKKAIVWRLAG